MGQSSVRLQGKLSLIGSNIDFNKSSKYSFILNEYLEVFNRECYNIVNEFNIITYLQNIVKRGVGDGSTKTEIFKSTY